MNKEIIIKHLDRVYNDLTSDSNNFIIPLLFLNDYITAQDFLNLYEDMAATKSQKRGYGIAVDASKYKVFDKLRAKFPALRDTFYILRTNKILSKYPIHIDSPSSFDSKASINWPLINCDERTETVYYKVDKHDFYNYDRNQDSIFLKDNVSVTPIFKYQFINPQAHLFRNDVWHTGINNTNEKKWRIMVKWELIVDNWQAARDIFNV